jgi:quercetin dioxygenase-like cupin family protein
MSSRVSLTFLSVVITGLVAAGSVGGLAAAELGAVTPVPVQRLALAGTDDPSGAPGRSLGLSKVVIPAGARLGAHHHPGTQVAYVASGDLTYSVKTGSVEVMKGPAVPGAAKAMARIGAGQRGVIHAGEWIVEQPRTVHSSANLTRKPVTVFLATLFPIGSPASIANK